jgi:hypothetical protein
MNHSHVVLMRHRLLALDRRYLFALPNITVGRVTREIVSELQKIAGEYNELLEGELSVSARLNEATVRTKIGDALGSAAWACEALREREQAREHFVAAAAAYLKAEATGKARQCHRELHRLNFYSGGDAPSNARLGRQVTPGAGSNIQDLTFN